MSNLIPQPPLKLALFQKRLAGDDCLWQLARLRFQQAGLGTEFYAVNPNELEGQMNFRPSSEMPATVHLPRDIDLFSLESRRLILGFTRCFAGRVYGLVVHDQLAIVNHQDSYIAALEELDRQLQQIDRSPFLFIEYAAGLDPVLFTELHVNLRHLERVSACIDIGHIGLWQVRRTYAQNYPAEDLFALKGAPDKLPARLPAVEAAVASALPHLLAVIRSLAELGKPLHFHLHDGHPLSTFSRYGVSDHLSFLVQIPLAGDDQGRRSLPLMFGPDGLAQIIHTVLKALPPTKVSFTLEIHETDARLLLSSEEAGLFAHWHDKTNAEKMNHWLSVLARNARLLSWAVR